MKIILEICFSLHGYFSQKAIILLNQSILFIVLFFFSFPSAYIILFTLWNESR